MLTPERVVILGAGTPFQGMRHSALRAVDGDSGVLDWVLAAFGRPAPQVVFVGGYQIEAVRKRFPAFRYVLNEHWRGTGSVRSLQLAPLEDGVDHYVCYSDIVMRPSLVARLRSAPADVVAAAVDSSYPARYTDVAPGRREKARADGAGRLVGAGYDLAGPGVGEFVGLLRIPAALVPRVRAELAALPGSFARAHLADLAQRLHDAGIPVGVAEARDEWSDLNSARCLARFILGTKGETLERLEKMVQGARVQPQLRFDVRAWRERGTQLAREAVLAFAGERLAVRSSAKSEDGFDTANAGAFESRLDVPCEPAAVREAVERVISSFGDQRNDHQILIQPMVRDVALSGVVLTRRLATGAPYYTINYAEGGDTSAVTSGNHAALDTVVVLRADRRLPQDSPPVLRVVLEAVREVERLLHYDALDVEFACDAAGRVTLLQVRPLVVGGDRSAEDDRAVAQALEEAAKQLEALRPPPVAAVGATPLWGSMPDWNPAEIIGVRPRSLASSLYFHLITDEIWARQRAHYGYRDLRGVPLIRLFAGQPYVDVRASLNSFIPATLSAKEAGALVEECVAHLYRYPELHDKVEFEVIPTCLDFDFGRWRPRLASVLGADGFERLAAGLRAITAAGMGRIEDDIAAVERYAATPAPTGAPLARAVALLEGCREAGTLPFAHLARAAFVAVTLLNSAVRRGAISTARRAEFLESLETVSKEFRRDARAVRDGRLEFEAFVARYGHLRPGTYEITSERYSSAPERFLAPSIERALDEPARPFAWSPAERRAVDALFGEAKLGADCASFDRFARAAIAGRESSKFVFTRGLSEGLEQIARFGDEVGLTRDDLSHVPYAELKALAGRPAGAEAIRRLRELAEQGRERARLVESIELPPLLRDASDLFAFRYPRTVPNFVTTKRVIAPAASGAALGAGLAGAIALIPQADPGYDWLFGQGIAGLITMFGGANSHMAIRAAELGLPAAIGVGEPRFEDLCRARLLDLDCGARRIAVEV